MYEIFECRRCNDIFDMTDEARKAFCLAGGCIIECPECGCRGLDVWDMLFPLGVVSEMCSV